MSKLRDPNNGCPWDIKQTFESLTPYTIEESYEVMDAIQRKDYVELQSELGDLLFQVVFYAQLAKEQNRFEFSDIIATLSDKLIRRHPHVFTDQPDLSEQAVQQQWEEIKSSERVQRGKGNSILEDIPVALPALIRAQKIQNRVSKHGFDWPSIAGVIDKVAEELQETREAIDEKDDQAVSEELGDLLFSCVNLIRYTGNNSEQLMSAANHKFETRFRAIEELLQVDSRNIQDVSTDELEALWLKVKQLEKSKE